MSTETSTSAARAANKAGQHIIDTVASAGDHTLPSVIETAEVALAFDVPTKVVLNQRGIVIVSVAGGIAVGAGVLYGFTKIRAKMAAKHHAKLVEEGVLDPTDLNDIRNTH
jgi:hypothetical protein